ncbi:uncharacterized protein V6R79_012824 [Siganus canaliculatus]
MRASLALELGEEKKKKSCQSGSFAANFLFPPEKNEPKNAVKGKTPRLHQKQVLQRSETSHQQEKKGKENFSRTDLKTDVETFDSRSRHLRKDNTLQQLNGTRTHLLLRQVEAPSQLTLSSFLTQSIVVRSYFQKRCAKTTGPLFCIFIFAKVAVAVEVDAYKREFSHKLTR